MHILSCRSFCLLLNLALPWVLTGFFTQISTLADVQENVMEYLHVLSRPKVIDQEHDVVWTEAYIDSTVSPRGPGKEAKLYPHPQIVLIPENSNCITLIFCVQ